MNDRRREDLDRKQFQELVMSTIADLTTAVTQLSTDVQALITAVQAAQANPNTTLDPTDQAALNAAVTQLGADDTSVAAETAAETPTAPVVPPVA
jgi:outer membrane murein-binding lipoprotein Lpp